MELISEKRVAELVAANSDYNNLSASYNGEFQDGSQVFRLEGNHKRIPGVHKVKARVDHSDKVLRFYANNSGAEAYQGKISY